MRTNLLVSARPRRALALARAWTDAGDTVTVVLCDEAAAVARAGHAANRELTLCQDAGVAVTAHDDALRRRGVTRGELADGVKVVGLDEIADLVADGSQRAVWL